MTASSIDHRGADLDRWLDAYAAGLPVGPAEIFSGVSQALEPLLPGYRYLATKRTFLHVDDVASHYLSLERGKGTLSLRFGVTHHAVERAREALFGPPPVHLRHTPRTVSMYTANMGPHSRGWYLPYRVQWPVSGRDGLSLALPEIASFVGEIVLPYLDRHRRPEAIRETFLLHPRHADGVLLSEQTVFAVDHLLGWREALAADRDVLLSQRGSTDDRRRVEAAFLQVLQAQNPP